MTPPSKNSPGTLTDSAEVTSARRDQKKLIALGLLVAIGTLFWVFLRSFLIGNPTLGRDALPLLLLFACFATIYGITIVLVDRRLYWSIAWLLLSIGGVLIAPSWLQLIAGVIFFFGGIFSYTRARFAILNNVSGFFTLPLRKGYPWTFTACAIVLAISFVTLQPADAIRIERIVPESLFVDILRASDNFIAQQIEAFDTDLTFREYILALAAENSKGTSTKLSPTQQQLMVREARKELENRFSIKIEEDETLGAILYRGGVSKFNEKLASSGGGIGKLLPIFTGVGLFLVLRTLLYPFGICILLIVSGLLRLLTAFGVVQLVHTERPVVFPTFT